MTDRTFRALTLGFLATTALSSAAWAQDAQTNAAQPQTTGQSPAPATNATDVTAPPKAVQQQQEAKSIPDQSEIIITATKREENLQNVPISVQVLGTRKLDQLNISNFEEYSRMLPSVSYQNFGAPGNTVVYMRGVATGGDGNHSGSLPSVGSYLDEQPITTIGGTLDVHIYDIARIESLAGPQGTLYGASSEAGTIRIITNKPQLGLLTGRIDGEINKVDHGQIGGNLEGMINIPIASSIAFRAVAFYEHDGGYIDNVFGERTYEATDPAQSIHFNNSQFVKNNINDNTVWGGRAALKVDLDDNWTVTPTFMYQNLKSNGVFWMDADQHDLKTVRFQPEVNKDKFWQAALTIEGKIANFLDVTYAGAYMNRPRYSSSDYTDYTDAYNQYYIDYYNNYVEAYGTPPSFCTSPGLLGCQNWTDNNGNIINPRQHIVGTDRFQKMSQELRVATPADKPIRALVGAFYQDQKNHIFQDYQVDNLATDLSVTGYPGSVWVTNQRREDKDWALFGEANWDITKKFTVTGGLRFYKFDNTLYGFAGFGYHNPGGFSTGEKRCLTVNGLQARNDPLSPLAQGNSGLDIPCYNVADVNDQGKAVPRRSKGNGHIYRLNAEWRPRDGFMFYATWSKGFRPGGINRQPDTPAYAPDFLTNYEAGWKLLLADNRLRWNGAIYYQKWDGIQFSYLGPNSLTIVQNGRKATSQGIETDLNYTVGGLSLTGAASWTNAKTDGDICKQAIVIDPSPTCSGPGDTVLVPSGTRLPITPKFKAAGTARYTWPMWAGKTHVQAALTYQGSAPSDLIPDSNAITGTIKSAFLTDLFAGYEWSRWSAELFVSNLFDTRNEIARLVVCSICTQTKIIPGRPRTVGLRLGAHF